jgi:hypothetical protein
MRAFDVRLNVRMREHVAPRSGEHSPPGRQQNRLTLLIPPRRSESSLLHYAREVAAKGKRQLGADRP